VTTPYVPIVDAARPVDSMTASSAIHIGYYHSPPGISVTLWVPGSSLSYKDAEAVDICPSTTHDASL
jgi:hypothetical protein